MFRAQKQASEREKRRIEATKRTAALEAARKKHQAQQQLNSDSRPTFETSANYLPYSQNGTNLDDSGEGTFFKPF